MAYSAIQPRAEGYSRHIEQDSLRRNPLSQINLYLPKDITSTIMPQQSQNPKYSISMLSCLGQYKNDEKEQKYKLPTLPLQNYMGGKITYPMSPRKSYSKS